MKGYNARIDLTRKKEFTLPAVTRTALLAAGWQVASVARRRESLEAVERATAAGLQAATSYGPSITVTAGNYGGKLGPFHICLHDVLDRYSEHFV